VEVGFDSRRLQELFNDPAKLRRRFGAERARKIALRLSQIAAAADLGDLCRVPQARCHQLTADRSERFSLDLDGPYRLLIEVGDDPIPRLDDGGIDRDQVHRVYVMEVTDTH
jgi:plasmid maintenance system killer protein